MAASKRRQAEIPSVPVIVMCDVPFFFFFFSWINPPPLQRKFMGRASQGSTAAQGSDMLRWFLILQNVCQTRELNNRVWRGWGGWGISSVSNREAAPVLVNWGVLRCRFCIQTAAPGKSPSEYMIASLKCNKDSTDVEDQQITFSVQQTCTHASEHT